MLLLTSAFALDCTGLTASTCGAVDDLEAMIEATEGNVIDPAAPARLQPLRIYTQLEALRLRLGADGCRADAGFDGIDGGTYGNGSFDGAWSNSGTGTSGGTFGGHQVLGTYDGDGTGDIGDLFGAYNNQGQAAANRDDGFVAGRWIRVQGRRGIYVALHGACDPGVDPWTALDPWFEGPLGGPATPPGEEVTIEVTTDDEMLWWIDGVQVPFDPVTDNTWQQVRTHVVELAPGDHVIAIHGTDNGGRAMVQLRATDSQGQVLRLSSAPDWKAWDVALSGVPMGWEQPGFDDSGWPGAILCGPPFDAPWNSDPIGGNEADFIWAGPSCSVVNEVLMRTTFTL